MTIQITGAAAAPNAAAANVVDLYYNTTDGKLYAQDSSGNKRSIVGLTTQDYRLIKVTEITTTGSSTYTPTSNANALLVRCIGGGGAGGSCATAATNGAAAGGGGGGGFSLKWITGPKSSYSVSVGVGGSAGAAGANPGGNGGDTTFDSPSVVTAKGGTGGAADTVAAGPRVGGAGGAGGVSSSGVGDVKFDGEPGDYGILFAAAQVLSGSGGSGAGYAGGGAKGASNATVSGVAGGVYGGGGSGGTIVSGGASQQGGAGGQGIIIVEEYS